MRLKFFFLPLFILVCMFSYAQYNFGLRFKSKEVEKKLRTGLDLTAEGAIPYAHSFNIKFDLSFRSYEGFGYIIRLKETNSNQQIDVVCKLDEVSPGLYLIINGKEASSRIRLKKVPEIPSNNWNKVEIGFNDKTGLIQLVYNNEKISQYIKFPFPSNLVTGIGVVNSYGFDTREVPYISIRSVSVFTDGKERHQWKLEQKEGEFPVDNIGGRKAAILNPEWEIYHHARWKLASTFRLPEKPQIGYDSEAEKVFMVCNNQKIYYFDLKSNKLDSITYIGSPPVNEKDNQLIIGQNSQLLVYSHQVNKLSSFDKEHQRWNNQIRNNDSLPKYWHHNKLINPVNNRITTLCGYGFYTYHGCIIEFNDSLGKWEKVKFSGDSILPRYLAGLGQNPLNKNQYYLFGGLGNKTGDQLLGTQFYYDLYLIDFFKKSIKRIWQSDLKGVNNFTPVNSLIIDSENQCFYTLGFSHNDEKTTLNILKASILKPEYEFLGDSIPYYFIDIQSYANIFYWQTKRELVTVTSRLWGKSGSEISIYTIQFPPGSLSANIEISKNRHFLSVGLVMLVVVLGLGAGAVFYLRRKKKPISNLVAADQDLKNIHGPDDQLKAEPLQPGSINLFGGFQVIDKKGRNITYRFSPILRELLIIMLLNSNKESKGISSFHLNEIIWPEKTALSAKNNRGVNITKLRNILVDVGEVKIIHENSFWKLQFDEHTFCDYYFVYDELNKLNTNKFLDTDKLRQLLKYLKNGDFLININTEWLDKYKGDTCALIVQFLETQLELADIEKHSTLMTEIANVIFLFDQLNETALHYKCKLLNLMGTHGLALKTYTDFSLQYKALYGDEYGKTFKQLLKD